MSQIVNEMTRRPDWPRGSKTHGSYLKRASQRIFPVPARPVNENLRRSAASRPNDVHRPEQIGGSLAGIGLNPVVEQPTLPQPAPLDLQRRIVQSEEVALQRFGLERIENRRTDPGQQRHQIVRNRRAEVVEDEPSPDGRGEGP